MKKKLDKEVTTKKPPLDKEVTDQELTQKDLDKVAGGGYKDGEDGVNRTRPGSK